MSDLMPEFPGTGMRAGRLTSEDIGRRLYHPAVPDGVVVRAILHTRDYGEPVDPTPLVVVTLLKRGDVALSPVELVSIE